VARQAHVIYVYERLPHHLDPFQFPVDHVLAFLSLVVMWLALWPTTRGQPGVGRLRGFVNAAILVGLVGLAIRWLGMARPEAAAGLLRFYWFRLADVAVPLGVALVGVRWIVLARMPLARAVLVGLAVLHAADCLVMRLFSQTPLADRAIDGEAWQSAGRWLAGRAERPIFPRTPRADRLPDWRAWRAACEWVAHSGRIAPDARFLTPRQAQTFKWYAERGEVANWKEIPQDARSMVQWWQRIQDIYATGSTLPGARYSDWLLARTAESLRHLGAQYQADYLITVATGKRLPLPVEYKNRSYIIYRLGPPPS
jgi:hypothetical protein